MMKIAIQHIEDQLALVAIEFTFLLADEFVLYMRTKEVHWNVEGRKPHGMINLFDAQYKVLDKVAGEVTDRLHTLGKCLPGSLKEYLELTCLSECSYEDKDVNIMFQNLCRDHVALINRLRGSISTFLNVYNDANACEFVIRVIERHEQVARLLKAHFSAPIVEANESF